MEVSNFRQKGREKFLTCEIKAVPLTGRGGLQCCETLRTPRCLDNRLADGGAALSLTLRPRSTLKKIPGTHFPYELNQHQDRGAAGRIN
jgi:hypothetical protein